MSIARRCIHGQLMGQCGWCTERRGAPAPARPQPQTRTQTIVELKHADDRGVSRQLTAAFTRGELDLSGRLGAPRPGWPGMPECRVAEDLRARGGSDVQLRLFMTFVGALD